MKKQSKAPMMDKSRKGKVTMKGKAAKAEPAPAKGGKGKLMRRLEDKPL